MARIKSRDDLIEYALRSLGKPVIEINVDESQLEDRADDALQIFQEYNSDAIVRTYVKYKVTAADVTNRYITIPDNLISVIRVLPIKTANGSSSSNMFSVEYQMHLNGMYDMRSPADLIQHEITKQYLALIDLQFNGLGQDIRFSRHANRLGIDTNWGSRIVADDYIVIEGYVVIDPEQFNDIYNDMFLKKLTTVLIKRQWGENLIKFEGMQLPGGVTLNGRAIYEDAVTELEKIQEDLQLRYELPPDFMVG